MRRLFSFLTPGRIKRLFRPEALAAGQFLGVDRSETNPEFPIPEFDLESFPEDFYQIFGRMLKGGTGIPCFFICDVNGKVIWENSERAFEIHTVEKDIVTHLCKSTSGEIAEIQRLVPYADGVRTNPADGKVRYAVVAPLRSQGRLLGALCGLNDSETSRISRVKDHLKNAASVLVDYIELTASSRQSEQERKALEEIDAFMSKGWGDAFLGMLCKKLSQFTGAEWVFVVSSQVPGDPGAKAVAVSFQGVSVESFSYDLSVSPLCRLRGAGEVVIPQGAGKAYPEDQRIKEQEIEGFAGVGLVDGKGKSCGALILMSRLPLENQGVITRILKSAAPRVALEVGVMARQEMWKATLQEQEERFQAIFQTDAVCMMITDVQGRIQAANASLLEALHYSEKEPIGKHLRILVPTENPQEAKWREQCLNGQRPGYQVERTYVRSDQSTFTGQTSVRMLPAPDREAVCFIEAFTDLSAQKDATAARDKAESELAQLQLDKTVLFQSGRLPALILDRKGSILDANGALLRLLGYHSGEIKNVSLADLFGGDPDEMARIEAEARGDSSQTQDGGDNLPVIEVRDKAGKPIRAEWTAAALKSQTGEADQTVLTLRDLRIEESQTRSLEDAQRILEALTGLPGLALAWLNDQAEFLRLSVEMENIFGRPAGELNACGLFDLLPAQEETGLREQIKQLRAGASQVVQWESHIKKGNGAAGGETSSAVLEFSLACLPDSQNQTDESFLLGVRDLSAERRLSSKLSVRENQYQGLYQLAPSGILFTDREGKILQGNSTASQLLVQEPGKLKGLNFNGWLEPSDRERLIQRLSTTGENRHFSLKLNILEPDSGLIPIRLSGRPTQNLNQVNEFNPEEEDSIWILLIEDLRPVESREQEINRLSHDLKRVEEHATALMQIQSNGILLADVNGTVTECNAYLESKLGVPLTGAGLNLTDCFEFGESSDTVSKKLAQCTQGKRELCEFPASLKHGQGELIPGNLHLHTVKDSQGTVSYLIGTWNDSSELTEIKASWSGVDAPLRSVLDESKIGMAFLDHTGKITQANEALCRFTDREQEHILTLEFYELLVPDAREEARKFLEQGDHSRTLNFHGRAGEVNSAEVTLHKFTPTQKNGKVWYIALIQSQVVEISLKRELEKWQQHFHSLFNREDVCMSLCDKTGQLLKVNPALMRKTGLNEETLRFKTWSDFMVEAKSWEDLRGSDCAAYQVESQFNFQDGQQLFGRLFIQPIQEVESHPDLKYAVIFQDITTEKTMEKWGALREARLAAFLANPAVGLAVLNRDACVEESNDRFESILSIRDSAEGQNIRTWLNPEAQQEFDSLWQKFSGGERSRFQMHIAGIPDPQGNPTNSFRFSATLLDQEASSGFAALIVEDLTHLEETRKTLGAVREQLARVEREKAEQEAALNSALKEKSSELDKLSESRRELSESLAALEIVSNDYRTQGEQLTASLDEITEQKTAAEKEIEALRQDFDAAQDQIKNLLEAKAETYEEMISLKVDYEHLQLEKEAHQTELNNQHAELKKRTLERDELLKKLSSQEEAGKQLAGERDSLEQLRDKQEKEIAALKQNLERQEMEKGPSLREILQDSDVPMAVLDESLAFREFNDAFEQQLLANRETLLSTPFANIPGLGLEEAQIQEIRNVFSGSAGSFRMDLPLLTDDKNNYLWLQFSGSTISQSGREKKHLLVVLEDRTPLYETEHHLAVSEARFLAVAESNLMGILMTDSDDRIFFCNPTVSRLLGKDENSLIGKTVNDFAEADDPREDVRLDQRCRNGEIDDYQIEKILLNSSGSRVWIRMGVRAVRLDTGDFWYAVRTIEDVSDYYEISEKLNASNNKLKQMEIKRHEHAKRPAPASKKPSPSVPKTTPDERSRSEKKVEEYPSPKAKPDQLSASAPVPAQVRSPEKKELSPEEKRTRLLKESVKITKSQKIDPSLLALPDPKKLHKESLRPDSAPKTPLKVAVRALDVPDNTSDAWILCNDRGTVVLMNRTAGDLLKIKPEESLENGMSSVLHVKKQDYFPGHSEQRDPETANANLRLETVWDHEQQTLELVRLSKPIVSPQGFIFGTVAVFRSLEDVKKLPDYDREHQGKVYATLAKAFTATASAIQKWSGKNLTAYLKDTQEKFSSSPTQKAQAMEHAEEQICKLT